MDKTPFGAIFTKFDVHFQQTFHKMRDRAVILPFFYGKYPDFPMFFETAKNHNGNFAHILCAY